MGFLSSILGSPSKSKTTTKPATVWEGQQPYLQNLYGAGQNLMNEQLYGPSQFDQAGYDAAMAAYNAQKNNASSSIDPNLWSRQSGGLFPTWVNNQTGAVVGYNPYTAKVNAGKNTKGSAAAGASGNMAPSREQFMKRTGDSLFQKQLSALNDAWMQQLAGPTNPYLTGMASAAMNQISKQFQEQIMPSLLGGGNAAGQLGGARYAQLQDSAAAAAQKQMGDVAQNIYGQAWQSGLDAQGKAIAMGENVMGAGWLPLMQQATLLGRPTVLSGGGSASETGASGGLLGAAKSAADAYKVYSSL